jgi:hypothetical protein
MHISGIYRGGLFDLKEVPRVAAPPDKPSMSALFPLVGPLVD